MPIVVVVVLLEELRNLAKTYFLLPISYLLLTTYYLLLTTYYLLLLLLLLLLGTSEKWLPLNSFQHGQFTGGPVIERRGHQIYRHKHHLCAPQGRRVVWGRGFGDRRSVPAAPR